MERHGRSHRLGLGAVGPIDYFVNVIAGGGAKLTRWPGRDLYFTGEAINPVVRLAGGDQQRRQGTASRSRDRQPRVGTILTKARKPQPPAAQKGEPIPSLQTTMLAIEKSTRKPIVDYAEHRFELSGDPAQTNVTARSAGLHGAVLNDFLNVEGTYTFHAVATYGKGLRQLTRAAMVGRGRGRGRSGEIRCENHHRRDASRQEEG